MSESPSENEEREQQTAWLRKRVACRCWLHILQKKSSLPSGEYPSCLKEAIKSVNWEGWAVLSEELGLEGKQEARNCVIQVLQDDQDIRQEKNIGHVDEPTQIGQEDVLDATQRDGDPEQDEEAQVADENGDASLDEVLLPPGTRASQLTESQKQALQENPPTFTVTEMRRVKVGRTMRLVRFPDLGESQREDFISEENIRKSAEGARQLDLLLAKQHAKELENDNPDTDNRPQQPTTTSTEIPAENEDQTVRDANLTAPPTQPSVPNAPANEIVEAMDVVDAWEWVNTAVVGVDETQLDNPRDTDNAAERVDRTGGGNEAVHNAVSAEMDTGNDPERPDVSVSNPVHDQADDVDAQPSNVNERGDEGNLNGLDTQNCGEMDIGDIPETVEIPDIPATLPLADEVRLGIDTGNVAERPGPSTAHMGVNVDETQMEMDTVDILANVAEPENIESSAGQQGGSGRMGGMGYLQRKFDVAEARRFGETLGRMAGSLWRRGRPETQQDPPQHAAPSSGQSHPPETPAQDNVNQNDAMHASEPDTAHDHQMPNQPSTSGVQSADQDRQGGGLEAVIEIGDDIDQMLEYETWRTSRIEKATMREQGLVLTVKFVKPDQEVVSKEIHANRLKRRYHTIVDLTDFLMSKIAVRGERVKRRRNNHAGG